MQEFLQALREVYGDISLGGLLSRQKIFGEDFKIAPENSFNVTKNFADVKTQRTD